VFRCGRRGASSELGKCVGVPRDGAPAGQGAEVSGWRAGWAGRRCPGASSRHNNGSRDGRRRRSNGAGGGAPAELRHAPATEAGSKAGG
jgi:hypothetical protein